MNGIELGKLLDLNADAWNALVIPIGHDEDVPLDPGLARGLLEAATIDHWLRVAREIIDASEDFFTTIRPTNNFMMWLGRSALEAFDLDDPRCWDVRRRMIERTPDSDGGLSDARELFEAMEKKADGEELAEVALLVAKGAMTTGDYEAALDYASRAHELFVSAQNETRALFAARRMGGANLCLGNLNAAMSTLVESMETHASGLPGGGTSVHRPIEGPLESALNEAATVAMWADFTTPEWVRCLGAIAERLEDDDAARFAWSYFKTTVKGMLTVSTNPESDIEVIVRQSGERGLTEAPKQALEIYLSRFPDDDWARRQVEIIDEHIRIDRWIAMLHVPDSSALDHLLEAFDDYEARGTLGEDALSLQVAEVLINHLAEGKDERALDLQQRLLDHKLERWGECPAVWLELQNLGTVLASFGRVQEAGAAFEAALEKQVSYFGDAHPQVQMTRRNLVRLRSKQG